MEGIIEKIINKSKYDTEVFVQKNSKIKAFFDTKLRKITAGDITTLTIRVTINNASGSATTTNLGDWETCLRNAIKSARVSVPLKTSFSLPSTQSYRGVRTSSSRLDLMTEEDMIEVGLSILNKTEGTIVQQLVMNKEINRNISANTNGIFIDSKDSLISSEISVTKKGATASEYCVSRRYPNFDFFVNNAVNLCKTSINPVKIPTKKMNVILNYPAIQDLLESVFSPSIWLNNVLEGKSLLKDKLNKKIFSANFSLTDSGIVDYGVGSSKFDVEGVRTQSTKIIEKGVLKNFISDWYSATKFAQIKRKEFVSSTGNSATLLKRPSVYHTNLIVEPGDYSYSELLDGTSLLINFLIGAHTVNPTSGDFSLNCENVYLVNNGILTPVKQVMISGNVYELFNKIIAIGKKPRSDGQVISPPIKFKNVQVIA